MGTSISYRSPNKAGWKAVGVALGMPGLSTERVIAEVWNAAGYSYLTSPVVIAYLETWLRHAASLSERAAGSRPAIVIDVVLKEARKQGLEKGADTFAAAAERALREACRSSAVGEGSSFALATTDQVLQGWATLSTETSFQLTKRFLGPLVDEVTRFFISRDAPGVMGSEALPSITVLSEKLDTFGRTARRLAESVELPALELTTRSLVRVWQSVLSEVHVKLTEPSRGG